jgi:cytochrome c553
MQSFAAQLSAADIKAIADYYGAQQPALKTEMRHNWL